MVSNDLLSLVIFAIGLLVVGGWALFLTRRTPEETQMEAERKLALARAEYADLRERIRATEELLKRAEQQSHIRIVVRNSTTGQFRGAYRRTMRAASSRSSLLAAHQF